MQFLAGLMPWGVTTVFSPSLLLDDFRRVAEVARRRKPESAAILWGRAQHSPAPEGHMGRFELPAVQIPRTTEAARAQVRALKEASVDAIKGDFRWI